MTKDIDDIMLDYLNDLFYTSTRIRTYRVRRVSADATVQEIFVTIDDAGPDLPRIRYVAQARAGGKFVDGEPSDTVEGAISTVDWSALDQPPEKVRRRVEA